MVEKMIKCSLYDSIRCECHDKCDYRFIPECTCDPPACECDTACDTCDTPDTPSETETIIIIEQTEIEQTEVQQTDVVQKAVQTEAVQRAVHEIIMVDEIPEVHSNIHSSTNMLEG